MDQKPTSVEEYFNWHTPELRKKLEAIQAAIHEAIPEAQEVISYGMPAFRTSEVLVYYAVARKHIGYYPTNSGVSEFKKELEGYVTSKGAIQFRLDQPLPLDLIASIAKFRAAEAEEKVRLKKKK